MRFKSIIFLIGFSTSFLAGRSQNVDVDILKSINPSSPGGGYWQFVSDYTYITSAAVPVSVFVAGVISHDPVLRKKSYEQVASLAVELVITEAMKFSVNRSRPGEKYPMEIFPYKAYHGRSFPSGHTSMAFNTAASLSIQFNRWYVIVPAYLWAGTVGYSRMYLGVHYPSDVLTGAVAGVGSAYLTHWLNRKLFPK